MLCTRILTGRQLLDNKNGYNFPPILSPFWYLSSSSCNKQMHCRSKSTCIQEIYSFTLICEHPFIWVGMASIYYWQGRHAYKIKSICMNKFWFLYDINIEKPSACLMVYLPLYKHLSLSYIKYLCWGLRKLIISVLFFEEILTMIQVQRVLGRTHSLYMCPNIKVIFPVFWNLTDKALERGRNPFISMPFLTPFSCLYKWEPTRKETSLDLGYCYYQVINTGSWFLRGCNLRVALKGEQNECPCGHLTIWDPKGSLMENLT